jgi:membrane-associated PAP2 superfamily phosphatase
LKNIRAYTVQFWLLHLAFPLLMALLLAFVYPMSTVDAWLIEMFYDASNLTFPLRSDWFLEAIMHKGLKQLMVLISLLMLSLWLLGFKVCTSAAIYLHHKFGLERGSYPKMMWLTTYHRQFLWVFIAMLISTSAISMLKHFSEHACPWDLLLYGGNKLLIPLFGQLPLGAKPGHCFPGGHVSGGFALMAFYFAFRDTVPKLARVGLVAAIALGSVMGWAQMMRGAHFMSHNLWTALIVWMIMLGLYLLWSPQSRTHKS